MSSFLKKLRGLKKKEQESVENIQESNQGQREKQEAQPSNVHHGVALDPAGQRTSQLLPMLVKPSPSPAEARRKSQPAPVVFPEIVQRQPSAKQQRGLSQPKKKSLEDSGPVFPELSDENFRYLWMGKKIPRGRTLRESLELMDEREILDTILRHLQPAPQKPTSSLQRKSTTLSQDSAASSLRAAQQKTSKTGHEKNALYRYYGLKLRDSRSKETVHQYLHLLLKLPLEEETVREGISEAVGVASYFHLSQMLMALRDFGHAAIARKIEMSENTEEKNASITVMLCYGQMALGARQEDLLRFIEFIVAELLYQFQNTRKDEALKKSLMKTAILTTKALVQTHVVNVIFPHKAELTICIIEVIEEEPLGSFSISVLHHAIITVSCMTALKPPMDSPLRSELVQKSIKKVFSLPSLKLTKLKAGSSMHTTQSQDFYQQTVTACLNMMTSLLSEAPSLETLEDILEHTNGWIDSPRVYERERAVKSTSFLMKYVSEHLDFDISHDFPFLGQLVALLSLHIADIVKEIGLQSAEALYHLHYIMIAKMGKKVEMRHKNRKGNVVKWFREDFFIPGPSIFYNDISKVAKAFGEHLTPSQINDVVLKAIDNLTVEDRAISQAAAVLLSSFLEECGMDMEDLHMIVKEIYNHLPRITDARTKEETLTAMVNLATKRLNPVVDSLLDCSMDCDESAAVIWKALVADPYCSIKLLRPLLKRLQDEDPSSEVTSRRHSKSQMPMAATNALCLILALPEASDVLQNKFPQLLLALITQIYFVIGSGRRGSRATTLMPDPPSHLSPLTTTVQALKNLIGCGGYIKEYNMLGIQRCWDMLSSPENFFDGIRLLIRTLFAYSKVHLRNTFKQANAYLRRTDVKERTVGMAFFTELLFHSEIGLYFVKQDIMDVLKEWMGQANPLMQLFSVRGLGYMLQHPLEEESLNAFVSPLINCAYNPDKSIAKESMKCLQLLFHHLEVEEYSLAGCSLYPQLLKHFNDEDNEFRICSISLFGMLLRGIKEEHRNRAEDTVIRSLVPLIIQLSDPVSGEDCRIVLNTIVTFLKLGEMPVDIFECGQQDRLYYRFSVICQYILWRYRQRLPDMLTQMMEYLRSRNPAHREAAIILIACNAQYMKPDMVSNKQIDDIYLAILDLQGDLDVAVSNAAVAACEELLRRCAGRINPKIVPSQHLQSLLKNNMSRK
ncbi:maestro heat-like repeat family member 5 [Lacerta agilis]|uniref:maestro heat-like repeat family member 5 n=1 Tax=Lacerta agilis TaxID=80427 RepID=UPI00141953C7|nr:maestro heat-like repeat family member 5 [Lacerta agilis]